MILKLEVLRAGGLSWRTMFGEILDEITEPNKSSFVTFLQVVLISFNYK